MKKTICSKAAVRWMAPPFNMPAVAANTEFDAAQALLDLQSNVRETRPEQCIPLQNLKEDMERSAKLFLSCLITSNVQPKNPNAETSVLAGDKKPLSRLVEAGYDTSMLNRRGILKNKSSPETEVFEPSKHSKIFKKQAARRDKGLYLHSPEGCAKNNGKTKVTTREIGTQTDITYQHHNIAMIEIMESTIKNLCDKIRSLEAQIKITDSEVKSVDRDRDRGVPEDNFKLDDDDADVSYEPNDTVANEDDSSLSDANDDDEDFSDYEMKSNRSQSNSKVLRYYNTNANRNDMVPIGGGHATVPSRLLRVINWSSYTSATRKLLTAVFTRRILATHSLTGKPSPAFPNKPAKKKLDPALVNDIVQTVVERCCVPENVVRTSITTKCADESKMFRTRQQNKKKRKSKPNRENIPPSTSDSED